MFDDLAAAVRDLQIPADASALREAIALHDRLTAKVTVAIGEFDELALWDADCARSMKFWLVDEGFAAPDAHRATLYGKRMRQLPVVAAAWQAGELSNGQVRAIVENLIDKHIGRFRQMEDSLVPALVGLSVKQTNELMTEWRARADAEDDDPPPDPERSLHFSQTLDGRYLSNGSFDPVGGDAIAAALAIADSGDLHVAASRRNADALVRISEFFLAHHDVDVTPRQRPQVSLLINAEDVAGFVEGAGWAVNPETGAHYDAPTVARYLCDCSVSRVVAERVGNTVSRVLDVGRAQRTATPGQRIALATRDRGCRWDCDAPPGWCEAHHIVPWEIGGPTDLDNMALFCGAHHDLIHRKGIELKLLPDATIEALFPDGSTRTMRPPGRTTAPPPSVDF